MLAISFKFSSRLFAHGDENFSFKGGNLNLESENFFGILISPLLRDNDCRNYKSHRHSGRFEPAERHSAST
jgi:hypothetical protein